MATKAKNLVIVESPAKAKTLATFLGDDYEIKSSFGHIRDLPKKKTGVDVEKNFEPTYEISVGKENVAAELRKAAKGREVWLASDEDREGEAIAWHVCILLGLDPAKTKRIVFHEITKSAITEAVAKPRTVDMKLVDAQQARRILDRLVGYELSPVLWKKVRTGLSAGRVQSVAVRLIVEREREIKAFKASSKFEIVGQFEAKGQQFSAKLPEKLSDQEGAKAWLESAKPATYKVASVDEKPGSRSPGAPFTTSALQQEAARRLGYSVRQTMVLAQRLYENGHITYMRTDSPILSDLAVNAAKDYILKNFGDKYLEARQFKAKGSSAQEAHEAIRPTNLNKLSTGDDKAQQRLYELIWQRTLASQMAPASVLKTDLKVAISTREEQLVASGEVLTFDGYLRVYGGGKDDKLLPKVAVGDELQLVEMLATETYDRAQARYSEASLVRKLEELGIGRPSTYAPTIGVIQDRGYVEKKDVEGEVVKTAQLVLKGGTITEDQLDTTIGADRSKLIPTDLAGIVTDFLIKYFPPIMDYEFTARVEEELDDIAEGKLKWQQALKEFYDQFHPLIDIGEKASRQEATQARELGKDPKTGEPIIVRFARFGPVLQLGPSPDPKDKDAPKPHFAPMPAGVSQDEVTLEQALPMFDLPRTVGKTEDGEEILASIGRFGPYVQVGKVYVSLKEQEPLTVTEAEARVLIAEKKKQIAEREIADFGKLKVLNGRYGPYVTDGKKNAKIPKDTDPKSLDEKAAQKLLDDAPDKPRRFRRRTVK